MLRRDNDILIGGITGRHLPKGATGIRPAATKLQMDWSYGKKPSAVEPRGELRLMPEVVGRMALGGSSPVPGTPSRPLDGTIPSRVKRRKTAVPNKDSGSLGSYVTRDSGSLGSYVTRDSSSEGSCRLSPAWEYLKISTPRQPQDNGPTYRQRLHWNAKYGMSSKDKSSLREQLIRAVANPPDKKPGAEPWESSNKVDALHVVKPPQATRGQIPRLRFQRAPTPIAKCEVVQIVDLRVSTFVERATGESGDRRDISPRLPRPLKCSSHSSLLPRTKTPNRERDAEFLPRQSSSERPRSRKQSTVINFDKLVALYANEGPRRPSGRNLHARGRRRSPEATSRWPAFPSLTVSSSHSDGQSVISNGSLENYTITESRQATRGTCRPVSRDYRGMRSRDEGSLRDDDSDPFQYGGKLNGPPPTKEMQLQAPFETGHPNKELADGFIVTKLDFPVTERAPNEESVLGTNRHDGTPRKATVNAGADAGDDGATRKASVNAGADTGDDYADEPADGASENNREVNETAEMCAKPLELKENGAGSPLAALPEGNGAAAPALAGLPKAFLGSDTIKVQHLDAGFQHTAFGTLKDNSKAIDDADDTITRNYSSNFVDEDFSDSSSRPTAQAEAESRLATPDSVCQQSNGGPRIHFQREDFHVVGVDEPLTSCLEHEQGSDEPVFHVTSAPTGSRKSPPATEAAKAADEVENASCVPLDNEVVPSRRSNEQTTSSVGDVRRMYWADNPHHGYAGVIITCLSPAPDASDHGTPAENDSAVLADRDDGQLKAVSRHRTEDSVAQRRAMFDDSAYTNFQHAKFSSSPQGGRTSKAATNICYNDTEKVKFLNVKIGEQDILQNLGTLKDRAAADEEFSIRLL